MMTSKKVVLTAFIVAWSWFPALSLAAEALLPVKSPLTQAVMFYSNEVLVGLSIFTAILGSFLVATVWHPPQDVNIPLNLQSSFAKFLTGLAGGIGAFFYIMHTNSKLEVLQPVWVLGVSFVTPITLQVAFPSLVSVLSKVPELLGRSKE